MTAPPDWGRNTARILGLLADAEDLSPARLAALDAAESAAHPGIETAWIALRGATSQEPWHARRMAVRDAAWEAVRRAGRRAGISLPPGHGWVGEPYWLVLPEPGFGAARAARFAACALAAPRDIDPWVLATLANPWLSP